MDRRILWIDDEPEVGTDTRVKMLKAKGYTVELAAGVKDAMASLDAFGFDLIILDIMMPSQGLLPAERTKEGYETGVPLMAYIRERGIKVPVIVVTAYPDADVEHTFRTEFGVKCYLLKPISQVELENIIEGLIG